MVKSSGFHPPPIRRSPVVRNRTIFAAVVAVCVLPSTGFSAFVTFGSQNIDLLVNAGPQNEAGFTYQAVSGTGWEVINALGNTPSSLVTFFNDQGSSVGDTVLLTRTGGGLFTFAGVDWRTISGGGSDDVAIEGLLNGNVVGTLSLTGSNTAFQTVASGFAGTQIDTLRVRVSGGTGSNALLLDNFNVTVAGPTAVPAPASLALVGLGAVGLAGLARRRMAKA
jgi:hypothetical protein